MTTTLALPPPELSGGASLAQALAARRSVRAFAPGPLPPAALSQLLWAAQGITGPGPAYRTAPSGGALHPLDVYAVSGEGGVAGLPAGVYRYRPQGHEISRVAAGDRRRDLAAASLGQWWMAEAPAAFVFTVEYARITGKYGTRGIRYALVEAGCAAQGLLLAAVALGLGGTLVGAFRDAEVQAVLGLPPPHEPVAVIPVGRPA
ncbi:SagB/ThcOx family dehydrogenase [Dissulfurirhabdus thermomarina]|uniref:SagB/ThcOx family dehydrogenase n=1 Tax=Dissulfurirhabdus thermomarina TaxID=1765737 RepID=A0A6N9TQ05_DISTH|nr:SagB/ThcOx family dehydrogenase [Dissulfurirhabdus thermomarina]NDY43355.1 SagB/ThcOx family dehydrogenase [Dissulfurirhabdus thermomarina]NMX24141.1 SagB/ThcOx family dehydrogenase [Dissulfurirhabdus thermomarina]